MKNDIFSIIIILKRTEVLLGLWQVSHPALPLHSLLLPRLRRSAWGGECGVRSSAPRRRRLPQDLAKVIITARNAQDESIRARQMLEVRKWEIGRKEDFF